ncbi:hypothetical protein V6N11_079165 [Hibiscus sabdariffa]|uniref:Uncharacterized protein n=1 Tax=Hibiscus sabdariffa TaxID=183260 RepID=A0ABR2RUX8_9ROSI
MHSNSFPVTPTVVALIVGSDSLQLLLWVQVCLMEWGHVEPSLYSCISAIMLLIAEELRVRTNRSGQCIMCPYVSPLMHEHLFPVWSCCSDHLREQGLGNEESMHNMH